MSLRVLWVEHTGEMGGGQLNLLRYLRHSSLDSQVLLLGDGPLAGAVGALGVPCTVVPFDYRTPSTLRALPEVRRLLRSDRCDVVVSNSLKSAMLVGLAGGSATRHITYLHQGMHWFSAPRRAFYDATAARSIDAYLSASGWTAGTRWGGALRRPLRVVHSLSGIDDLLDRPGPDFDAEPLQVLSLSRFIPEKGLHTVVAAARLCREWGYGERIRFSLVGEGVMGDEEYGRRLRAEAASGQANVAFLPYDAEIGSHLADSQVLVHASSIPEAFGQVIMQGLAAGLVVVSTAYGGAAELFQDGYSGIRFDKEDAETLARELVALCDDRARCAALSRRGRAAAAGYRDDALTQGIDAALGDLVGTTSDASAG